MVEIELVRRRRVRRTLRRRADLLLATGLSVAVLASLVVALDVVDDDGRRAPTGPDRAGRPPGLPGLPGVADRPGAPATPATTATPDGDTAATAATAGDDLPTAGTGPAVGAIGNGTADGSADGGGRAPLDPAPEPPDVVPPPDPQPGPQPDPQPDGPLTRAVDPLLGRATWLLPLLGPVRAIAREVTTCADAVTSRTPDEAGTACAVPASP